jgi:opacity protein-like surface antigen/outer membrane receptor protein involved in Fe transport
MLLSCWAGIAASQTQQNGSPQTPQTNAPAAPAPTPAPPAGETPASPPSSEPTPASPPPSGETTPGATTIPPITVTAPPARTPPRQAPASPAPPAPAAPAPTPTLPARTAVPSTAAAGTPSQTATFDAARNNIFAPIGTAPTTFNREAIESLPQGTNTPLTQALLQFPGVTQDSAASGNIHIRNEHANVSYRINGILLPDGLGAFGQFLDTSFVGSLTLITGALPAQYGLRTAAVVDITTATFNNVGEIGVYGGSRQTVNSTIQYGGKTGSTEYFFTGRYLQNILGIENPRPSLNAIHDATQQDRSFGYVSTIIDPTTRLSFIGGTATNKFQIPNTPGAIPSIFGFSPPFTAFGISSFDAGQLNETQVETYKFGVLALQKSVEDVDLQLAYFTRSTSIQFTPDPIGDLVLNGVAASVFRGSVVNGIQGDGAFRLNDAHTLRAGVFVSAEKTTVASNSQLLPFDMSVPVAMQTSDVPFPAIDTSTLLGWLGGVYLQDEWKLTNNLTLNAGARFDQMWQYLNANQLSPRVSLTYQPTADTTFHAGFARTFTPPVQVIAASTNTDLFSPPFVSNNTQAPGIPPPYYPMLPERANVYDIGVVQKVIPGLEVGLDTYLKTARDLIDDGQFGQALVLNGFNYDKAENIGVELKAVYTDGNFRTYANWAWANQRATTRVSHQYLFDPAGDAYTANNWIFTDHTQIWTGSAGVSYLWYGTRLSADLIYGSGLRSGFENTDHNPSYAQVNTGLSHEYDIPGWDPVTLRFDVVNLFDTSYVIRNGTGVGVFAAQYGPRRGFYFGLAQKFGPGANIKKPEPLSRWRHYAGPWTWAGFYIGGNAGYGTSRFNTDMLYSDGLGNQLTATSFSTKHDGALGGGQVGYNWQYGMWVAGFETDIAFEHYRTATAFICAGAICNPLTGFDAPVFLIQQHNLDWFGTVRGRLGAAVTPDALAYVTGGLAYGEIEHTGILYGSDGVTVNDTSNTYSDRALRAGWAAGAGFEARLAGNVTAKIEYLHIDFGYDKGLALFPQNATPIAVNFNSRITENLVRVGLNYKFDPYVTFVPEAVSAARERARPVYKTPVATLWTWTGFYFGANAGYAAGTFSTDTFISDASLTVPVFAGNSSVRLKGGIGGVQAGYNWQAGMWLAGLETDIAFSSQRSISGAICPGGICDPAAAVTVAYSHNLDWFGTVRGRLGALVTSDAVAYVTGGLAVGGIAQSGMLCGSGSNCANNPVDLANNFIGRTTAPGWTVGGGIEARLVGNVTGKIEYLHMSFSSASTSALNSPITPPIAVALTSRDSDDIIRLGLNYKFDPNAAAPTYQTASISTLVKPRITFKGPVVVPWTWTGYYLGINAGYGLGNASTDAFFSDTTIPAAFATSASYNLQGRVLGVETGYNFQMGSWLWGIEGDLQLSGLRGTPTFVCPGTTCNPAGPVVAAFDQDQKLEWFGTLRARFGAVVTPNALVFVTGGAAVAGLLTAGDVFGYNQTGIPTTDPFSNVSVNAGWTVGGGVEARLFGNWTGKIEYLYMDFGALTTNKNPTVDSTNAPAMTLTASFNSHVTDQVVRAGINYKFD